MLVLRKQYRDKLKAFQNQPIIKVITGIRRCGKSTLLSMYREELIASGVDSSACISINFEDLAFENLLEYHALYQYILDHLQPGCMNYLFLDEIQLVPLFEKVIDSLQLRNDVDIYITGSNAQILSGELATRLSGRYIEVSMLPLSFAEFYELVGGDRTEAFTRYYRYGGFPYAAGITDTNTTRDYIEGILNTILVKDIINRGKIGDPMLLNNLVRFMADNVGNPTSVKKIADTLTSAGRRTTTNTIDSYLSMLLQSFMLYECNRFDIKGKQHLQTRSKYYLADTSIRTFLLGESARDIGHVLENIVYLELLRRGWRVSIGKMNTLEVDFVATRGDELEYFQVAASVMDEATFEREFAPLRMIHDHYPKTVLTMDALPMVENGIRQKNIIDFLLDK